MGVGYLHRIPHLQFLHWGGRHKIEPPLLRGNLYLLPTLLISSDESSTTPPSFVNDLYLTREK